MSQRTKVYIIGVGMTKFEKPGKRTDFDYPVMVKEAVTKALQDAKVSYDNVKAACVGYVYGDSACGQRALYQMGFTGCPIYNVNNNCATGSTALMMAKQFIESGSNDCVLALGFEKMETGSVMPKYMDRTNPLDKHVELMVHIAGESSQIIFELLFVKNLCSIISFFSLSLLICIFIPRYKRKPSHCPIVWKCWT